MYIYILIPIISSWIGWVTNKLAIINLFRPLAPVDFFLFKLHGVIPRKRKQLTEDIAKVIDHHLVNITKIRDLIRSSVSDGLRNEIDTFVNQCTDLYITQYPVLAPFSARITEDIKTYMSTSINSSMDKLENNISVVATNNLDITEMVIKNLNSINVITLEAIIKDVAHEELKHIEYLGAVIGFIVGLGQVLLLLLLQ